LSPLLNEASIPLDWFSALYTELCFQNRTLQQTTKRLANSLSGMQNS